MINKNLKINNIKLFGAILVTALFLGGCNTQQQKNKSGSNRQEVPEGWETLFNGETLNGWEVTQFGTQGPVSVSNGSIFLGMGDGCTGVTWKGKFPEMNYEISLEAKKISGNDFFCGMTFPVDSTFCSLIVGGWGGPVVGLSTIDGLDGSENETRTLKKFAHDRWYHIRIKVTQEKIEAWIDEEKLIDFTTESHQLSIRPEVSLSRPFGICSWITTAELKNIRLKKLSE